MQYTNYNYTQYRPPYQQGYPLFQKSLQQLKKEREKSLLQKKSSGLGYYILSYFLALNCIVIGVIIVTEVILLLSGGYSMDSTDLLEKLQKDIVNSPFSHSFQIFAAAAAAMVPGLIYLKLSKNHISDVIKVSSVKPVMLILITLMGMGIAMVANIASDMVTSNFSLIGIEFNLDMDSSSSSVFTNVLYVISTALTPAFAEEFGFRGILMGTLRKYGDSFAIIVSAIMFGAMHGNIIQIPFAFILGLIFGYVDCKTNSIIPSIVIHFVNNFYAVILDILQSQGTVSNRTFAIINLSLFIAFLVLGVLAFLMIAKKDKNFLSISDTSNVVSLSLKEKITAFFSGSGVIITVILLALETVATLFVL